MTEVAPGGDAGAGSWAVRQGQGWAATDPSAQTVSGFGRDDRGGRRGVVVDGSRQEMREL